jgi:hypothetical protein
MTALLEQVRGLFSKRQAKRTQDFDSLAAEIAAGREVAPEDVVQILDGAGKTPDELQRAVTYRQQRLDLRAKVDDLPRLEKEAARIEADYQAEAARWKKLEEEHEAILAPMRFQSKDIQYRIKEAKTALQLLRTNYAGPLTAEIAKLESKQAEITRAIRAEEHPRDELKARLAAHPRREAQTLTEREKKAIADAIGRHDETIAKLTEQHKGLEREQADLESQMLLA